MLWKGDEWLLALSNDEDVAETSGEGVSLRILDVNNLIGTWVVLNVHENTNTTDIVSTLNENLSSILEFNNSINLTSLKVILKSK